MSDDFYPFVDSGDPAPDNEHLNGIAEPQADSTKQKTGNTNGAPEGMYATRIAVYDDMLSTPRVIVIEPKDVRTYLEETTNTVYRCMKEQGGGITLMVIREIVENFIHAHFAEPIISILDGGNTIRFADQGPGINDKERAFEFGVTSANRGMKRYIRGTGAGFPMVQEYLQNAGGAVSIEDNMGQGTVVTVSIDPARVAEIERNSERGAAVRASEFSSTDLHPAQQQMSSHMPVNAGMNPTNPYMQSAQQSLQAGMQASMQQPYQAQQMSGAYAPYPYQQWQGYPSQMPTAGMGAPAQDAGDQMVQMPGQPMQTAQPMPQGQYVPWPNMYPQGGYMSAMQPYQQVQPQFSTNQQMPGQTVYPNSSNTVGNIQPLFVSDRGRQALTYLGTYEHCGPTDLSRACGSSTATWSRELVTLCESGLVIKRGQKFHLTQLGIEWVQNNGQAV